MVEKPVIGTKTMVVSPHYLASAAGAWSFGSSVAATRI